MKTKRIKATLDDAGPRHPYLSRWILPADAASYEQMVEQMAKDLAHLAYPKIAMIRKDWWCRGITNATKNQWRTRSRAALRAIGITEPKKGTK